MIDTIFISKLKLEPILIDMHFKFYLRLINNISSLFYSFLDLFLVFKLTFCILVYLHLLIIFLGLN